MNISKVRVMLREREILNIPGSEGLLYKHLNCVSKYGQFDVHENPQGTSLGTSTLIDKVHVHVDDLQ